MSKPNENSKKQIIETYTDYVKKFKIHPTQTILKELGFTESAIRHNFGNFTKLRDLIKKDYPTLFNDIIDEDFFTKKNFNHLKGEVQKYKKFIVTTAVNGCKVHTGFLKNLEHYCKVNDAALLILPSNDPAHNLDNKYSWNFDSILSEKLLIFDDLSLNDNLYLSTIKISAKQLDPITGLSRIGQRNGSFIYASPKQRLKYVATGNNKIPHALMTTGAITTSNYKTDKFMSERMAYIADNDHVLGAIVVELIDNKKFHFRQIQASNSGSFIDLGKSYENCCVKDCPPEAIVLGDWHSGETDPIAKDCFLKLTRDLKPKMLIVHDLFNGLSCEHHSQFKYLDRAKNSNNLDLKQELILTAGELNEMCSLVDNIVVVKSNHDEFLNRYLNEMRFKHEPQNLQISLDLSNEMVKGNDPLKYGIETYGGLKAKQKIRWLKQDESFKIAKIELGQHGQNGANGSKGSVLSMENGYGNCITGHSHSAQILRSAWVVGTSTYLNLSYNKGSSSWTQTSCLVYKNGSRQLVNCIDGKYKI